MSLTLRSKHIGSMVFLNAWNRWMVVNRLLSAVLVIVTVTVAIPLCIAVFREGAGPWGFGVIGLHILLPLSVYAVFALPAFCKKGEDQWLAFLVAHFVSVSAGLVGFFTFPILPGLVLVMPVLLAVIGILLKRWLPLTLMIMLILGIAANMVLLKWEWDFGRSVPIIELFQPVGAAALS